MKIRLLLSFLVLASVAFATESSKPAPAPAADAITVDAYNALKKERDDARAQAAVAGQLQAQNQYLQVLAERNELAIRVVQNQLEQALAANKALNDELAKTRADLAAATAPKKEEPKK